MGRLGGDTGVSSLEAEFVWVADDCVGIHCESIENHSRVDEVLLNTLQASIELLKPHHLGSTCNKKVGCQLAHGPQHGASLESRGLGTTGSESTQEGEQTSYCPGFLETLASVFRILLTAPNEDKEPSRAGAPHNT